MLLFISSFRRKAANHFNCHPFYGVAFLRCWVLNEFILLYIRTYVYTSRDLCTHKRYVFNFYLCSGRWSLNVIMSPVQKSGKCHDIIIAIIKVRKLPKVMHIRASESTAQQKQNVKKSILKNIFCLLFLRLYYSSSAGSLLSFFILYFA